MRHTTQSHTREHSSPEDAHVTIPPESMADFRLMLREQIAGDVETLSWLVERGGEQDRRAPHLTMDRLRARLRFLWKMADEVGGLYSVALPLLALYQGV